MFKEKKEKKKKISRPSNLDNIHQSQVKYFEKSQSSIGALENKLKRTGNLIRDLGKVPIKTMEQLDSIRILRNEEKALIDNITRNINLEEEIDYYSSTQEVLGEYYHFDEKKKNTISIEEFYHKSTANEEKNQKVLLSRYLTIVKPDEAEIGKTKAGEMKCEYCKVEMLIDHTKNWCCPDCGNTIQNLSEMEVNKSQSAYSFQYDQTRYSVYQRINHFKEWLNQVQGKENTEIPTYVIEAVQQELKKMMFTNLEELSHSMVRKVLKKLNLAKYYENIFYIIHKINGLPPPTIGHETEQELIRLFKQIEEPFQLYKSDERKNILRYGYILYKLCELLELDELLPCFKLLKNRDKLIRQDVVWKMICHHNRWEYITSI